MKSQFKVTLFSDTESTHDGTSNAHIGSPDSATTELLIDLGRGLYKLMFQLLLLIESDHKIHIGVVQSLRQADRSEDLSSAFAAVRHALLRSIDDTDMDSLDTSTSTEGENTPTPSPCPPMPSHEFENSLIEMLDGQKWSSVIVLVRQHRKHSSNITLSPTQNYSLCTSSSLTASGGYSRIHGNISPSIQCIDTLCAVDDITYIMNAYAQRLVKERSGNFNNIFYIDDRFTRIYSYTPYVLTHSLLYRYFYLIAFRIRAHRCT